MNNDTITRLLQGNYLKEFDKEVESNSDRGLVLICGSIIDQLLKELLTMFLIESDKIDKDLFKGNGPLSTFDSKLKMSYYLGLITKEELSNITYLQRIRNIFAHEYTDISFESGNIANICSNFKIPKDAYVPSEIPLPKGNFDEFPTVDLNPIKRNTPSKDRFIFAFKYLYTHLLGRAIPFYFSKRKELTKNLTAYEFAESINNSFEEAFSRTEKAHKDLWGKIENQEKELKRITNPEKRLKREKEIEDIKEELRRQEEKTSKTKEFLVPLFEINKYTAEFLKNSLTK